jgi:hypothetical protein
MPALMKRHIRTERPSWRLYDCWSLKTPFVGSMNLYSGGTPDHQDANGQQQSAEDELELKFNCRNILITLSASANKTRAAEIELLCCVEFTSFHPFYLALRFSFCVFLCALTLMIWL